MFLHHATIVLTLTLAAGATQPSWAVQGDVAYADVQRALNERCTSCHSGEEPPLGLALDSWEHLVAGSEVSATVSPSASVPSSTMASL